MLLLALILALSLAPQASAFPSEELQKLWDVPTNEVNARTVKVYDEGSIRVEKVYYFSRPFTGAPTKIFGYYTYPTRRSGKLPAILLSHGGGGTASLERAVSWSKRGYAVLAIDLPGKGENRERSRSTGPDMDVPNLLLTRPDPSYNYLVHAVAAARYGINYLSQRNEVDPERIGMIGLSWGGVITLLTNGQDKRLKAAVNVFGAGYIPEACTWQDYFNGMSTEEMKTWDACLDPKNFLASQNAPILFITGTNDHCYYLPTFQKSYEEVRAEKNIYLIPNLKHKFMAAAQFPALTWLDQKLKNPGIFPKITLLGPFQKGADKIIVSARAEVHSEVKNIRLYYSAGGPQRWTTKEWLEIAPYYEDGVYYFALAAAAIKPEVLYFVSVKDDHGGVSSSLVHSLFAVRLKDGTKTFAVSAPIKKVFQHDRPIKLLNGMAGEEFRFQFSKKDQRYQIY